jgi:DNA topoisomerase IA
MGIFFKSDEEKYEIALRELHDVGGKIIAHQKKAQALFVTKDIKKFAEAAKEVKAADDWIRKGHAIASDIVKLCKKLKKPVPGIVNAFQKVERSEKEMERKVPHKGGFPAH